jgi:hypothetical protein
MRPDVPADHDMARRVTISVQHRTAEQQHDGAERDCEGEIDDGR